MTNLLSTESRVSGIYTDVMEPAIKTANLWIRYFYPWIDCVQPAAFIGIVLPHTKKFPHSRTFLPVKQVTCSSQLKHQIISHLFLLVKTSIINVIGLKLLCLLTCP